MLNRPSYNNYQMQNQMQNKNRYNIHNSNDNECGVKDNTSFNKPYNCNKACLCLDDLPLGIAYVPWQKWESVLDTKEGLKKGTIFSKLIYPFYGCAYKKGVK